MAYFERAKNEVARSVVNWSAALSDLGYPSYSAYLRSPYWAKFRAEYYRRYGRRCQANMCNRTAEHLHHGTYERLGHERFNDVLAVCANHHQMIHRRAGGIRDLARLLDATIWCCGNLPRKGKTLEQAEAQVQAQREKNRLAITLSCPTCGAEPHASCTTRDGLPLKWFHEKRRTQIARLTGEARKGKSRRKRALRKYQATPCPQCGADAGEMCRSITWGKPAKSVHSARREQYV